MEILHCRTTREGCEHGLTEADCHCLPQPTAECCLNFIPLKIFHYLTIGSIEVCARDEANKFAIGLQNGQGSCITFLKLVHDGGHGVFCV